MKYIIDRFEGDFAIVELSNKTFVNIPKTAIPPKAKEGAAIMGIVQAQKCARYLKKRKRGTSNLPKTVKV